ncbi:MAG: hypothetical protein JWM28_583 [Chitinophagaceae bacterium]|nr:hypothetical protein [Chitinophagaceae bacterium]
MNLQQMITPLLTSYQTVAEKQKSSFINAIPPDLCIETDTEALSTLMSSLLYIVARCSKDSAITVDAGAHGDLAMLTIKDNCNTNNYGVLHEFQHVKLLSKKIDGLLDINRGKTETTISLSFINNADRQVVKELRRA